MDFFLYRLESTICFVIASIPLIIAFVLMKLFKQPPKVVACSLALYLPAYIFFWVQLKDLHLVLYQGVPYLSSFIWIWAEHILTKRDKKSTK